MTYLVDIINKNSITSYYQFSKIINPEITLHKSAIKLLKHPNNKRLESIYQENLNNISDKELAKMHNENVQLRRDAIKMLKGAKKLNFKSKSGDVVISMLSATLGTAYLYIAGLTVVPITIPLTLAGYLIKVAPDSYRFNKAIKGIIYDYKKSLVNSKIKDTVINLRYEYPKSELSKIYN